MKEKPIFHVVDFPILRRAKYREVKIKDVPSDTMIIFSVDEQEVRAQKDDKGFMVLRCTCPFCGKKGEAKNILCERKISVLFFLLHHGGRVSEIEKELKR